MRATLLLASTLLASSAAAQGFGSDLLAPPVTLAKTNPGTIVTADVGADGDMDLLTMTFDGSTLTLVRNEGSGDFAEPQELPLCPGLFDLGPGYDLVDLDADGVPDLFVLNEGTLCASPGTGDGEFGPSTSQPLLAATTTLHFAVADLNGDGLLDVLLESGNGVGFLYAAKGLGDLAFGPFGKLVDTRYVNHVSAVDVDEDGDADVLSLESTGETGYASVEQQLVTYANGGDGSLVTAASTSELGPQHQVSSPVDLNRDGRPDVLAWSSSDGAVLALLGAGDGSFEPLALVDFGSPMVIDVLAIDLDADGFKDIAAVLPPLAYPQDAALAVQRLVDLAPEGASVPFAVKPSVNRLGAADFDGDGLQDVALNFDLAIAFNALGPVHDLGLGSAGGPTLVVSGVPATGQALLVHLTPAGAPAPGVLLVGLETALVPAGGSLLVPEPLVIVPVPLPGAVGATWPPGVPAGTLVYLQAFAFLPGEAAGGNTILLVPEP